MNSDRVAPSFGRHGSTLRSQPSRLWIPGLLIALSILGSAGSSSAGDPIRFVRPKSDEKAPLRVNYSAEKAQATDRTEPGAGLASGAGTGGARTAQPITVTRRGRDSILRKGWNGSEDGTAGTDVDRNRMQLERERARWRMSQAAADEGDERRSLFSSPSTFGTPPAASAGKSAGAAERSGSYGTIDGAGTMPRSVSDLGLRGLTAGDAFRPGGRTDSGPANGSSFGGGLTPGAASDLSRATDSGLGARSIDAASNPRGAGLGLDNPGANPYRAEPAQTPYEAPGRPLRSAFDLPSRPR
jgi:hypothetical protein